MPHQLLPPLSLPRRALYFCLCYALKLLSHLSLLLLRVVPPIRRLAREPDYVKTYHADVPAVHFFLPPSSSSSSPAVLPPLYISLHGGGFITGTPLKDSGHNRRLSTSLHCTVAAVSYRLAPRYRYPTAERDVAAIICAVLRDPELRVDRTRVVVGGFSAGGTLALKFAQGLGAGGLAGLVGGRTAGEAREAGIASGAQLRAVVAWYPKLDFTLTSTEQFRGAPAGRVKQLLWRAIQWAYLGHAGTVDLREASVAAGGWEGLERVCIINGKRDPVCQEGARWIWSVLQREEGEEGEEGDVAVVEERGWGRTEGEGGRVVRVRVDGVGHAFTHRVPVFGTREQRAVTEEVVEWVFGWAGRAFEGERQEVGGDSVEA
ncbi:Alpha/Beta hydrolase protein [Geopyxis carbonaria]|nr:Alpha/Beta hydrolase protein [Geopyxis carbonaria]